MKLTEIIEVTYGLTRLGCGPVQIEKLIGLEARFRRIALRECNGENRTDADQAKDDAAWERLMDRAKDVLQSRRETAHLVAVVKADPRYGMVHIGPKAELDKVSDVACLELGCSPWVCV